MSTKEILTLCAVAAIAYAIGKKQAMRTAAAVDPYAGLGGADWMTAWQG